MYKRLEDTGFPALEAPASYTETCVVKKTKGFSENKRKFFSNEVGGASVKNLVHVRLGEINFRSNNNKLSKGFFSLIAKFVV